MTFETSDPDETLDVLIVAIQQDRWYQAFEASESLAQWLDEGNRYPECHTNAALVGALIKAVNQAVTQRE